MDDALAHRLEGLRQFGRNSFSGCLLYDDVREFRCTTTPGFVGYLETSAVLLVMGEPVCPPEHYRRATVEFIEYARQRRCGCVFIAVGDAFVDAVADLRPTLLVLGEDMLFDTRSYRPRGDGAKKVRSAINQFTRNGGFVREYRPCLGRDLVIERAFDEVASAWLKRHSRFQMHFLSLDLFRFAEVKRYFYVVADGRPMAFLACLPIFARNGYLFEDLVRHPSAPTGTTEALVVEAIRAFRADGVAMATFGLSPRLGLNGASNLGWAGRVLVGSAMKIATRLSHLDRLYHSRKKYHTGIAEPSYLLKFPPGIRAREIAGVLRTFNLMPSTDSARADGVGVARVTAAQRNV